MEFREYTSEQRKHIIDASYLYERYISKLQEYAQNYKYSMFWHKVAGKTYLAKKKSQGTKGEERKYLGEQNEETTAIYDAFMARKSALTQELSALDKEIKTKEAINKALKLTRTPNAIVDIYRRLNELCLDDKLVLIGTNALYCYEAHCGVFLEDAALSTVDIDILSRRNKKLSFAFKELMGDKKIVELIKSIDKSFEQNPKAPYQFINKANVCLEIINPAPKQMQLTNANNDYFTDVVPLEMDKMEWLENSRLFKATVVAVSGKIASITTLHPMDFAIYKNWLSQKDDRAPLKKSRDAEQSKIVTKLILDYMTDIDAKKYITGAKHFKNEAVADYEKNVLDVLLREKDGDTQEVGEWVHPAMRTN